MQETFDWIKPSPLWQPNGQDFRNKTDFFRPVLLEMQTDDFMNEFFAAVRAPKPDALKNAILKPAAPNKPLKLFQPINVRYYLACASLCCRIPGFPDREVRAGEGEKIFFVIRKVASGREHAWIVGDDNKGQWKPVANQGDPDLKKEERLPMFPTTAGRSRCGWIIRRAPRGPSSGWTGTRTASTASPPTTWGTSKTRRPCSTRRRR